MIITSEILIAYSLCPQKAFLLACTNERRVSHPYVQFIEQERQKTKTQYIGILKRKHRSFQNYDSSSLVSGKDILADVTLTTNEFQASCEFLTKTDTPSALDEYSYEPMIVIGNHSIDKTNKLSLYFAGYVLAHIQNKPPEIGRIITRNLKSHKAKLANTPKILTPLLLSLQEWLTKSPSESPPIILNKHCSYCQYAHFCKEKAQQEDHLSLMGSISTPKGVQQYEKKGIFTIKQLSYLFKPRKPKKRIVKPHSTHKPELQALAIRMGKIYLQVIPKLPRQSTELFLDIEGIPDQHRYYLIGLLVYESEKESFHSFWASSSQQEAYIWQQFIDKVQQYPNAPIYHYGSYEPRAINKLGKRYDTDCKTLLERLVNVNTFIYGKVYFPVYSNGLKEIGRFIGATWMSPISSGLESLVWRHQWEEIHDDSYKEALQEYNKEDCYALKKLTDELSKIEHSADILSEVDFANQPKFQATDVGKEVHSQFETILEFAHADYDKKKISFKSRNGENEENKPQQKRGSKKGFQGQRKIQPKATRTVRVPDSTACHYCGNQRLHATKRTSKRLILDLVLTRSGIRKTITEYMGTQRYCPKCKKFCIPPEIRKYPVSTLYGHGMKAFLVYQRVALHMAYEAIEELFLEQFYESIPSSSYATLMKQFSKYYAETSQNIARSLLQSPVIHADETPINVRGKTQYVWVFTNGKYVVFKLRKTREATIVHEFLGDYAGVLVSDFYAGYDSVKCRQQKCWVHLIRDFNRDLWASPFDKEYEMFLLEVRNLIIPIMETVLKYGLKKRNLNKFKKQVDIFYDKMIIDRQYKSELTVKYQKRFARYRESLFTFLEQDGIPWHNNTAERALRHLAIQGSISGKFYESFTPTYLRFLEIRQTCRFQKKSFFKFLFSGETDIDQFR